MQNIVKGLKGVKIILDEFLVYGLGDTQSGRTSHCTVFSEHHAKGQGLQLNLEKVMSLSCSFNWTPFY